MKFKIEVNFDKTFSALVPQKQGLPGGDTGEGWSSSAPVCLGIRVSKHTKLSAKVETRKVTLSLR